MAAGEACALDAAAFGWLRLPLPVHRPLLVIWMRRQPDEAPATELTRRKQHYENLIFGSAGEKPFPERLRTLEPSLVDFQRPIVRLEDGLSAATLVLGGARKGPRMRKSGGCSHVDVRKNSRSDHVFWEMRNREIDTCRA
jgi:hypothetical protein